MSGKDIWARYLDAYTEITRSRMALAGHEDDFIHDLKKSLFAGGWQCAAALSYVPYLSEAAKVLVQDAVIGVALSVHGDTEAARAVLASMSRESVVHALDQKEPDVVAREDFEEWGCLVELWASLGYQRRAEALARRGLVSTDADVREWSQNFLAKQPGTS